MNSQQIGGTYLAMQRGARITSRGYSHETTGNRGDREELRKLMKTADMRIMSPREKLRRDIAQLRKKGLVLDGKFPAGTVVW